jgi:hypothetical protein
VEPSDCAITTSGAGLREFYYTVNKEINDKKETIAMKSKKK